MCILSKKKELKSANLNLYSKELKKKKRTKPKLIRRKELIKIRAEISEIEIRKQ